MTAPTQAECKLLDRDDFEYILQQYSFKTRPMGHQYASMLWAKYRDAGLFLHDIGTGKTLAALYTVQIWGCNRILIVSPNSVRWSWQDEIVKHTDEKCCVIDGEGPARRALMANDFSRFHIINYEGLKTVFGKKVEVKKQGKNKGRYVPDHETITKMDYDCLIFDEHHRLKSFESLQTQISYQLARFANKILMLSGTPMAKDIRDFWSELMVLDDGATLGGNLFEFLHTYMNPVEIKARKHRFTEWFPKKGAVDKIVEKVSTVAIRYDVNECFDLPELICQERHIDASAEQEGITKAIIDDLRVELTEGNLTLENVINKASKLAQISSGFVFGEQGEEFLRKNPKLDELIDLIQNEVSGQCIVFHNFVPVAHAIEARLRKHKIKFRAIRGEIKNKAKQIKDFQTDSTIKVLLAHPQSGGEGLNLQNANVVVFFDQIYTGATLREQCIGRVHRAGQDKTCIVIDLIIVDSQDESIDQRIHSVARSKKDLAQSVLDWIRDH